MILLVITVSLMVALLSVRIPRMSEFFSPTSEMLERQARN
jgi:hypothetical protein